MGFKAIRAFVWLSSTAVLQYSYIFNLPEYKDIRPNVMLQNIIETIQIYRFIDPIYRQKGIAYVA